MSDYSVDFTNIRRCLAWARRTGAAVTLVGIVVLLGWAIDLPVLKSVVAGYALMKPLTALCFVFCGAALFLSASRTTALPPNSTAIRAAKAISIAAMFISLTSFFESALNFATGMDEFMFRGALLATGIPHPGQMAPATAMTLGLICFGILGLDAEIPAVHHVARACTLLATLMGLIAILGYLYGAESLYRFSKYSSMALHTSLLLFALGVGILLSRPHQALVAVIFSDHFGGWMARRLLPIVLLAPIGIGWLRLMGERAGLYGMEFGLALFTASNIVLFTVVVWLSARSLIRIEAQRRLADATILQSASALASSVEQLRESEERFSLFMKHLPATAFLKDSQGRYLWANAAWRAQFPHLAGDLMRKTDADLWPPDVAAVFAASDAQVLAEDAPWQLFETTNVGGNLKSWLVSKFPLRGKQGDTMIGGVAFDATETKRLEAQLYQAQKLEAVGLLAGGIAHDFNNLLTVILGYSEVIRTDLQHGENPIALLDEIHNAAERAAALTKQLLAFGRKQVMQPRMISVNSEVEGMQSILRRIVRENVTLNLLLAPDIGSVKIDPVQIHQVILNLTMNAQDAMPDGGGLTIETANVELDDSYAHDHPEVSPGPFVMLAVSDTGFGMDAATLAHIFEPFFTTKLPGKGTGLGLASVYGIVKQSGGHIWAYSELNHGTSFKLYFPRAGQGNLTVRPDARASLPLSDQKKPEILLIVEDENAVRSLMVQSCRSAGYEVLAAAHGEDALALIEEYPGVISLLVTDVIMPGISGRTLADRIVRRRPETKVLFCSGYAESAVIQHGVLDPGMEFLQKPFSTAALLQRIRSILGDSASR